MSVRLFVGNLPYSATEVDIRQHFGTVGDPMQVVIPTDRDTGGRADSRSSTTTTAASRSGPSSSCTVSPSRDGLCRSARRARAKRVRRWAPGILRAAAADGWRYRDRRWGAARGADGGPYRQPRGGDTRQPELRSKQAAERARRIELRQEPQPGRQSPGTAQGAAQRPDVQRRGRRAFS